MANGVWRTISGRRVFIAEGESISEAIKKSGKFNIKAKTPEGKEVTKLSNHALQRQKERNILSKDISNALEHPIHTEKATSENDKKYIGKNVTVILSTKTGKIITVYKTKERIRKKYEIK